MLTAIERVKTAMAALARGEMIILIDDPDRENEGDLIIAAEKITDESMSFFIRHCSGIVCISMLEEQLAALDIPSMVAPELNTSSRGTPFMMSVDARDNITTGVSSADRVATIQALMATPADPKSLVKPGHIFPLRAHPAGVFGRNGHTEGALDLVRLAGLKPGAVLCEIMNPDGTMTRGEELNEFSKAHDLVSVSIADIFAYRLQHENLISESASTTLHIEPHGSFNAMAVRDALTQDEHLVLYREPVDKTKAPLVRIHSSCLTGDLFASTHCDCHKQLQYALEQINKEGGLLVYLQQEGRGIGLVNKIKAYALQAEGLDTVEANEKLGLPIDARHYYITASILKRYNIQAIRLLTNNPHKLAELEAAHIASVERIPMPAFAHPHNQRYLQTKKDKLKHDISFNQQEG